MSLTCESTMVEDWLQWFATEKQVACRAYLCTWYSLNALDSEALINAALLQVSRHWPTIQNHQAYLWKTLRHTIAKQERLRAYERQQLRVYAQQRWLRTHVAARPAAPVGAVLAQVAPRQRHILAWYTQGYADAQVAAWLKPTPEAVRVARHGAYRTLRTQFRSSSRRYHFRLCRTCACLRQNPKIGSWKDNDLRASTSLFSVICDSTLILPRGTTAQEKRIYKAARLYLHRMVYSPRPGLDDTLRAQEVVR